MTEREKLVEIMARAMASIDGRAWDPMTSVDRWRYRVGGEELERTLSAAGWTLVPPSDGR